MGVVSMADWLELPVLPGEFERRNCETRAQIATVLHRVHTYPSPYRSQTEAWATVAAAYQARQAFYDDLIAYAMRQGPGGLWFTVLLDARAGCQAAVQAAQDRAVDAAPWDPDYLAWRTDLVHRVLVA